MTSRTHKETMHEGLRVVIDRDGTRMEGAVAKTAPFSPSFPFVLVRLDHTGTTMLVNRNEIEEWGERAARS